MLVKRSSCSRPEDQVAEWLRRWTANPLGFPRVSSNLILIGISFTAAYSRWQDIVEFLLQIIMEENGYTVHGARNATFVPDIPAPVLPDKCCQATSVWPSGLRRCV